MRSLLHIVFSVVLLIIVLVSWITNDYGFGSHYVSGNTKYIIVNFGHAFAGMGICLYGIKACDWATAEIDKRIKDREDV